MSSVDVFLKDVPNYEIRDEIMYIASGDWCLAMPLRNFRRGMVRASKCIAEYEANKAAVIPIKRKRGGHAASS